MSKRYFCEICGIVRRCRSYPRGATNTTAPRPADRIGRCPWHSRVELNRPRLPEPPPKKVR